MPPTKMAATKNITDWFAQHERSQSPPRVVPIFTRGPPPPPPPAEDSEADETGYSSDSSVDEIERLWQQLKEKRAKLATIKGEMSRRRRELRDMRRKRDDADNDLMNLLRPMLIKPRNVVHISSSSLDHRLKVVSALWNDYNQLESIYEGQEVLLDEEEVALELAEMRFFNVLATGNPKNRRARGAKDGSHRSKTAVDVPYILQGISPDGPTEMQHPRFLELQEAVGDRQNAKEDLSTLLAEYEVFRNEKALKENTGQDVPHELTDFFDDFEAEEARLRDTVSKFEAEVERLKRICLDHGLIPRNISLEMLYLLDISIEYEDLDLDDLETTKGGRPQTKSAHFPELVTHPEHVIADEGPFTPLQALQRTRNLPMPPTVRREKLRQAEKEYTIDTLLRGPDEQEHVQESSKRQRIRLEDRQLEVFALLREESEQVPNHLFVNRWLLQILRLSPLEASLLYSTFIGVSSLKIRNPMLWQWDVLHYWWRDVTMVPVHVAASANSQADDNASKNNVHVVTPPMSRAATAPEGLATIAGKLHDGSNSDAVTVHAVESYFARPSTSPETKLAVLF